MGLEEISSMALILPTLLKRKSSFGLETTSLNGRQRINSTFMNPQKLSREKLRKRRHRRRKRRRKRRKKRKRNPRRKLKSPKRWRKSLRRRTKILSRDSPNFH